MYVKQIDEKTALELYIKGNEVLVLVSGGGQGWEDMIPDTLKNMLDGAMFFRREPAPEKPVLEPEEFQPTEKKRAKVDTGKLLALHKAGWSNTKIADELGVSDVTVGNYLRKWRETNGTTDKDI